MTSRCSDYARLDVAPDLLDARDCGRLMRRILAVPNVKCSLANVLERRNGSLAPTVTNFVEAIFLHPSGMPRIDELTPEERSVYNTLKSEATTGTRCHHHGWQWPLGRGTVR